MRVPSPIRRITETVRDRIVAPVREQLGIERAENERLAESMADLERALHDPGWQRFADLAEQEFTVDGLRQLRRICLLFSIKNPLIKRGLALRAAYVWGQGVEIAARANGKEGNEQDVQGLVDRFLNDPGNVRAFTGAQARVECEHALGVDGELFLALFTNPRTGRVQVRTIPADEITDIICNPEDASEPWYYHRRWVETSHTPDGATVTQPREALYPSVDYRPRRQPRSYAGLPVQRSAPMVHVAVNKPRHWRRGIPDAYASLDWARAYKIFLEDWATVVKALSRFSWRLSSKGAARQQAREKLAAKPPVDPTTGKAQDAGSTAVTSPDAALEAIPKSGATIDSDSGRPLAAMVAAGLGVPVTMLLGDPGTTGARATAETLNQPTKLEFAQRRDLWTSVIKRILDHVITEAVRAPQGFLDGTIARDPYTDSETVTFTDDTTTVIDVDWPDTDTTNLKDQVTAIVEANSTGVMPGEQTLRLLLTALGVRNVDDLVETMTDDSTGEFRLPRPAAIGGDGPQAAAADRGGGDPADTGPGPMGGDEDDDEPAGGGS